MNLKSRIDNISALLVKKKALGKIQEHDLVVVDGFLPGNNFTREEKERVYRREASTSFRFFHIIGYEIFRPKDWQGLIDGRIKLDE